MVSDYNMEKRVKRKLFRTEVKASAAMGEMSRVKPGFRPFRQMVFKADGEVLEFEIRMRII